MKALTEDDPLMTERVWKGIRGVWDDMPLSVILASHWVLAEVPPTVILVAAVLLAVYEDHYRQPVPRMRRIVRSLERIRLNVVAKRTEADDPEAH